MATSARPVTPTLLDFLPVTGTLVIVTHPGGSCLISATAIADTSLQVETRLSGDFQTPDEVYVFLHDLRDHWEQRADIWPLIELSTTAGPALSRILSWSSGYSWEPVQAPVFSLAG